MILAGHDWYAEARSSVIPYVGLKGTRQADIVSRMGLSKQAVQQMIVDLEGTGILKRDPDPVPDAFARDLADCPIGVKSLLLEFRHQPIGIPGVFHRGYLNGIGFNGRPGFAYGSNRWLLRRF